MAAATSLTIQEITNGRMVLGLGVSHKPVNDRYEIDMGDPVESCVTVPDTWISVNGTSSCSVCGAGYTSGSGSVNNPSRFLCIRSFRSRESFSR